MIDDESFSLKTYIEGYKGPIRVKRLLTIAKTTDNELQQKQAVELAVEELQKNKNILEYEEVIEKYGKYGLIRDEDWIEKTRREHIDELQRLEAEESSARNNNLSHELRAAKKALGHFHWRTGDSKKALTYLMKMNEGYSRPEDIVEMAVEVIQVALYLKNYSIVNQYVSKALQSGEKIRDKVTTSLLDIATGIAMMGNGSYGAAAGRFLLADIVVADKLRTVCTVEDVALMGTFCALASFTRKQLNDPEYAVVQANTKNQTHVLSLLNNTLFTNFLDSMPEVRALATAYFNSNFSVVFKMYPSLEKRMKLGYHINGKVQRDFYKKAREKAIKQYVTPFHSVDMNVMAPEFACSVAALEKELAHLIRKRSITARIDSHKKILYAPLSDQRSRTLNRIQALSKSYVIDTQNHLLRMNVSKHKDFLVNHTKAANTTKKQFI